MGRYRPHPVELGIVGYAAKTQNELKKVSRIPRASATSIDKGELQVNGGQFLVNPDPLTPVTVPGGPVFNTYGLNTATAVYVTDNFDRFIQGDFGTSDDGQDWTVSGPDPTEFNVNTGTATINLNSTNIVRLAYVGPAVQDGVVTALITAPVLATGASYQVGLVAGATDGGNYYAAELSFQTSGAIVVLIRKSVGAVLSTLGSVTSAYTYTAGSKFWLRFTFFDDGEYDASGWPVGNSPPASEDVTVFDTGSSGFCGVWGLATASNTNNPVATFSNFTVKFPLSQSFPNVVSMGRQNAANTLGAAFGSMFYADTPVQAGNPQSSMILYDRYGNQNFSDAGPGAGIADPRIQVHFFDSSATKSTTSATFVNFMSTFWYVYHPNLRATVLINVPASTTYEVRLNVSGGGQLAIQSVTNSFVFVDLIASRTNANALAVGSDINGNSLNIDLEWRRVSGTGTATMAFVEAVGIDLSWTNP